MKVMMKFSAVKIRQWSEAKPIFYYLFTTWFFLPTFPSKTIKIEFESDNETAELEVDLQLSMQEKPDPSTGKLIPKPVQNPNKEQ
jgi:hypothetical protein